MDVCCNNSSTSAKHHILEPGCKEKAAAECFDSHQKKGSEMIDDGASAKTLHAKKTVEKMKKKKKTQ